MSKKSELFGENLSIDFFYHSNIDKSHFYLGRFEEMKKILNYIIVALKGILMGACDVIPGVSGGTIAVITGIYERLIQSIKNIVPSLKLFFTGKWKTFWKNIDGTFLLCLIFGIGCSFLLFANIITNAMEKYPILIWSFFVGLILVSAILLGKQVKWNRKTVICLIFFGALAFFITSPENAPLSITSSRLRTFICGAIAICAMILPGISGSFMLVLLGEYEYMMEAIKNLDILTIGIFLAGAVIGIIAFSNVLSWLFKHFKMITLSSLTGFMLGSLNKIWPRKEALDSSIGTEKNILPGTGDEYQLLGAVICFIIGIIVVLLIEYLGSKFNKSK